MANTIRTWLKRHFPRLSDRIDGLMLRGLLWSLDHAYPVTDVTYDLRLKNGKWMVELAFTRPDGVRHLVEASSESAWRMGRLIDSLAQESCVMSR